MHLGDISKWRDTVYNPFVVLDDILHSLLNRKLLDTYRQIVLRLLCCNGRIVDQGSLHTLINNLWHLVLSNSQSLQSFAQILETTVVHYDHYM